MRSFSLTELRRFGFSLIAAWGVLAASAGLAWLLLWVGARSVGAEWIATAHVFLSCGSLCAAGFVAGRGMRHPFRAAALTAVPLCFFDLEDALSLNIPWLARLVVNSLRDARYLDSLVSTAQTHLLLLGCLFFGAWLSLPSDKPPRIVSS